MCHDSSFAWHLYQILNWEFLPGQTSTDGTLRGILKGVDSKLLKLVYGSCRLSISMN
jgi:hypothetical protein